MFKIRNGQNGGLELSLCGMELGQVDCGVFQQTKLTKIFYTRKASGFWVTETEARSAHRGGIVIFYPMAEHFAVEELRLHGLNVITFQLVMGRQRWHVVGCYIASSDALTIEDVNFSIRV